MKINKKYIIIGSVLLLLCWLGNTAYYNYKVLKKPLFVKNYYDIPLGMNNLKLYYIQNLNSQDKVVNVKFPEIGQEEIYVTENDNNNDKLYYKLKCITVSLYNDNSNDIPEKYKNKVITKAQIKFLSGKIMDVNLGKIYLYSDENHSKNFNYQRQAASSDDTGDFQLKANKDLGIIDINSKFYNEIKDVLQIYVNGKQLSSADFPIVLLKDDTIDISYKFNYKQNEIMRNNSYFFSLNILSEDPQGNIGSTPCFINSNFQSPEDFDIDALKKESD